MKGTQYHRGPGRCSALLPGEIRSTEHSHLKNKHLLSFSDYIYYIYIYIIIYICFHISHSLASRWFSIFFLKKSERFWEQSTALNSSNESFPSPSWSEETSLSNGFVEGIPYKMLDIYNTYIYMYIYTHIHLQDVKMEIDIKIHGISWDTNMTKNSWSRTKLATRQLIVSFKKICWDCTKQILFERFELLGYDHLKNMGKQSLVSCHRIWDIWSCKISDLVVGLPGSRKK